MTSTLHEPEPEPHEVCDDLPFDRRFAVTFVVVGEGVQHRLEALLQCHTLAAFVLCESEVVEDVSDVLAGVEALLVAERDGGEGDVGHRLGEALDDGGAGL